MALDIILSESELKEIKMRQELKLLELTSLPLSGNETYESRARQVADLHVSNQRAIVDAYIKTLSKTTNSKAKLKSMLQDLQSRENELVRAAEATRKTVEDRLQGFEGRLKVYIDQSTKVKKKVTGDYLVLRHNARIAEKLLCERRQSTLIAREKMQVNLDALLKDASQRRSEVEENLRAEQERVIQEARENVMEKEQEVDELAGSVHCKLLMMKKEKRRIKASIEEYERLYRRLDRKRTKEVRAINAELKKFRDMVAAVEMKMVDSK